MMGSDAQQLLQQIDRRLTEFVGHQGALLEGINREIKEVKGELREVRKQTTLTNGRVNAHDVLLAGHTTRIDGVCDDLSEMKGVGAHSPERIEEMLQSAVKSISAGLSEFQGKGKVTIEAGTGENRGITQRDVWIVVGTVGSLLGTAGALLAILKVLGPLLQGAR